MLWEFITPHSCLGEYSTKINTQTCIRFEALDLIGRAEMDTELRKTVDRILSR